MWSIIKSPLSLIIALIILFPFPASSYTHDTSLINWKEYSSEVFYLARKEKKPIFMLITAVWCHWCHVYEEKTLETREVADYINKNYIPIFLDFDRRKDISLKYSISVPATVILSPDGKKVHFESGYIEKGHLLQVLKNMEGVARGFYGGIEDEGKEIQREKRNLSQDDIKRHLKAFEDNLDKNFDTLFGGFGLGRKMPFGGVINHMLDLYELEKNKRWLDMTVKTLDNIAGRFKKEEKRWQTFEELKTLRENTKEDRWLVKVSQLQMAHTITGLYDEVEGGFFRFATQRDWSYPHFEKMLDDQAELIRAYLHLYNITKDVFYKDVAKRSLDYVMTNLYDRSDGRFFGSQDADEVYYHFTADERKKVVMPRIDRTSYTSTNANMVITLLYASTVLKDDNYKKEAIKTLDFFLNHMLTDNGVLSFYDPVDKRGFLDGQLEDNAWFTLALIEGYKITKEKRALEHGEALIKSSIKNFYNEKDGGFIERRSTSKGFYREDELVSYKRPLASNGLMAYALIKAYELSRDRKYLEMAKEGLGLFYLEEVDSIDALYFQKVGRYILKPSSP